MTAAAVQVDGACWGPRHDRVILHPTSFTVPAGHVFGVVGANGAGKSTLLRLLYRFHRPTVGTVMVDGEDIWAIGARAAARKVAAVLQEQPTDFALTVREIVALGRSPHRRGFAFSTADDPIVDTALERLDLADLGHRLFGTLSGGERQRTMVARALAQEPQLLIMDEPTNHLDIRHQLEVLSLIGDLDLTIVTSLHDLNVAADICDDILILQKGCALGFGPPDAVLSEDLVSRAFRVGARREWLSPSDTRHFTFHLQNEKDTIR